MKQLKEWNSNRKTAQIIILTLILIFVFGYTKGQDDIHVIEDKWLLFTDSPNSLHHYLTSEAYTLLDAREEKISQFTTPDEWKQRQQEMKQTMWNVLGSFPDKTPLNPQITGKVAKEGYSIENVIFESLPGFYVTASLFIADNIKEPRPAILFCSGHSTEAYRKQLYQLPLLNLVKKGFIVLAIDPVGQGERLQYFDPGKGGSVIGGSTKEHSYPSVQAALIGQSVARYFVWDGIRAIDYLISRKEVDSKRIGVHGLSGGGTQTAYISALDDRVAASAPACYITSYRRLMESIGVQDGEQNFYHGIVNEIDHADFIEMRAPKPTLIMANTNDFFSIQGARETYSELKRVYTIFGDTGNIEIVEDDYGHGYTRKNREALYAFFQKHLMLTGSAEEQEVEYLTGQELQKTSTGQLSTSLGGETIFTLNRREAEKSVSLLQKSRENLLKHVREVPEAAKKISGYKEPSFTDDPVFTGRIQKEGHVIEKYFVKGEGDYVLPYLLIVPEKENNKAVIYLHPEGKESITKKENEMNWLVENGFTVLAPDLLGTGELGNGALKGDAYIDNISYNIWYTSMLIGRSIVGIQAADVVKLSHLLKKKNDMKEVYGVAREEMSAVLLHAAAFDPGISRVALIKPYSSYRSFIINRFYKSRFVYSLVPGALKAYDLPDLASSLAPAKLLIAGMTDANGQPDNEETGKDLEVIKNAYIRNNAENRLEIKKTELIENPGNFFSEWIK